MAGGSRLPLSGWLRRAGAILIDLAVLVATWFGFVLLCFLVINAFGQQGDLGVVTTRAFMVVNLVFFAVLLPLLWGGLLIGIWGRTPGKTALKLKVVSAVDHRRTIGFWKGIGREVVRAAPFLVLFLILFVIMYEYVVDYSVTVGQVAIEGFVVVVPPSLSFLVYAFNLWWLAPVWGLIDHLWALVNRNNQTWHDKAIRSLVVVAEWNRAERTVTSWEPAAPNQGGGRSATTDER